MNSQECDYYFTSSEDYMAKSVAAIQDVLADWGGRVEVVSRPLEFAEGPIYDLPSASAPFGIKMSAAEEVDQSINGVYVNALGSVVDNGNDNFDYIIVQHNNIAESEDTLFGMREEIFGNHIYEGGNIYVRDETAGEDRHYDASDVDEDFMTVVVFDGSQWPSTPGCVEDSEGCHAHETVYKGSEIHPTTVILGGSYLGNTQGAGRTSLTMAAVKTITDALDK
jgi:hypothetical protein